MKLNNIEVSELNGYLSATDLIKDCYKQNGLKKTLAEFWSNSKTTNILLAISNNTGIQVSDLYFTKRGKLNGGTWVHPDLIVHIYNWLNKLPSNAFTRDEIVFCEKMEKVFNGIMTFEKQYRFGDYLVDLFCKEISLVIEFDEKHHLKSESIENDIKRQSTIETEYNVNFIRHKHNDDIFETINKIINYKISYNVVQAIKSNKVPTKGIL